MNNRLEELLARWAENAGIDPKEFVPPKQLLITMRIFLRKLPLSEVLDAIDHVFMRVGEKEIHDQHQYFCGICWNKVQRLEFDPENN